MGSYRYVSTAPGQILNTKFVFTRYGQLVEMDDSLAAEKIKDGFPLVPETVFASVGHTDVELKTYGKMAGHPSVPPDFADKRNKVWALLQNPSVPPDPEPTAATNTPQEDTTSA